MIQLSPQRCTAVKLAAILTSAVLTLTACGTSNDSAGGSSQTSDSTESSSPTSRSNAFPVTVKGTYGDITVKKKPERIAALPLANAEFLAALDVPVIAVGNAVEYGGNKVSTIRPWFPDQFVKLIDTSMVLDSGEAAPEAVAKHKPDLIVGGQFAINDTNFKQLASIAPTYGGSKGEGEAPWQKTLEAYGAMTGKQEEAKKITSQIESDFKKMRSELPGIQGKKYVTAWVYEGGKIGVGPEGSGWPEEFGLVPSHADQKEISPENYGTIDADVVFLKTFFDKDVEKDPRILALPASKNGTLITIRAGEPMLSATDNPTPLSLPWLRDNLGEVLKKSQLNKSE